MSGRFADAISAAEKLERVIDDKVLTIKSPPMAEFVESFLRAGRMFWYILVAGMKSLN